MTLGKRIERVIKTIRTTRRLPYQEVASSIDQSVQYLKRIRKDEAVPSVVMLKALCYDYGINYEWLSTGNGPMFLNESQVQSSPDVACDIFLAIKNRLGKYDFGKLSKEELVEAVDMMEMLAAILTSDDKQGWRAIKENLKYFEISVLRKDVIVENKLPDPASETDRASPSPSSNPKAKISGGNGAE